MIKRIKPELLSPAGNPEALSAAIKGGCDAVYLGGRLLNARMRARNFDDEDIKQAVSFCHDSGVRIYITLNTVVFDREIYEVLKYAEFLYNAGCDALIIADMGLASLIKKYIPEFEIHASTQMSGHNSTAARFLHEAGFSRMVAARELPSDQLAALIENSPIETEVFVHGAFCVSHSGQCLLSWALGGRSGNRGQCAQPCRMRYNNGYPISLRDNCLASHIPELITMGASSLKLEGRLKPPSYVYAITSVYRRLLDENRPASQEEIKYLDSIFSRGGFTDGYFKRNIGKHMLGVRGDDQVPQVRIKSSGYHLPPIKIDSREAVIPDNIEKPSKQNITRTNTARFYNHTAIPDGAESFFDIIYLPLENYSKINSSCTGVMLPSVIYEEDYAQVKKQLSEAYNKGARHALVGNIGHIALCDNYIIHGDFRLNVANSFSAAKYSDIFEDVILSPELILPQIRDIRGKKSVIVYGNLPLMLLEKPVMASSLRDSKGVVFPIIKEKNRDMLINSVPIYMADHSKQLAEVGVVNRHFIFTTETSAAVNKIIKSYIKNAPPENNNIKRIK